MSDVPQPQTPNLPTYQPPRGLPVATRAHAKPLIKLTMRMFQKPKVQTRALRSIGSKKKHKVHFY